MFTLNLYWKEKDQLIISKNMNTNTGTENRGFFLHAIINKKNSIMIEDAVAILSKDPIKIFTTNYTMIV